MPPPQCPECGRFLSRAFMVGLAEGPAACPRCENELTADRFDPDDLPQVPQHATPDPSATEEPPAAASVRPPDLPPSEVDAGRDVLHGWDGPDAEVVDLLARRTSIGGADPTVVAGTVIGAGLAGGLLGAIVARHHRPFGAIVGSLAGASGAVLGMRLFEEG